MADVPGWRHFLRRPARAAAEAPQADARPVSEHVRRRESDPELLRRRKLRRRTVVAALAAVCLAGSVAAVVGEGGYLDSLKLEDEVAMLGRQVAERQAAVDRLEEEVRRLEQDPLARERVAREQLGLLLPGEIDLVLPREGEGRWDAWPPP